MNKGIAAPIEYGSHSLTQAQKEKWTIAEKEAYALVFYLDKWKSYFLHRNDTIVYCDNITVANLLNDDIAQTIEQVVAELIGDKAVVEVETAE